MVVTFAEDCLSAQISYCFKRYLYLIISIKLAQNYKTLFK
jgi:hypothetical protein